MGTLFVGTVSLSVNILWGTHFISSEMEFLGVQFSTNLRDFRAKNLLNLSVGRFRSIFFILALCSVLQRFFSGIFT